MYKYLLHITVSQSKIYLKNYFVEDIHCGAASAKPLGAQSTTFGGSGGIYSQQLLGSTTALQLMTTRSGRGYKRQGMSSTETPHAVEESAGEGDGAEGGRLETSGNANPDIMAVVELLMQDRRRREEEIAEDRARRECEMERRVSEMKGQMETFCKMMERTGRGKTNPGEALVKVSKLADTDDIEGYLLTFERQMTAYEADESRWAFILAPHLTGRAQKAYMAMATEDAGDYRKVKEAI